MGFLAFALLLPQPTQAQRGAQLQRLGLLAPGHVQRLLETGFRLACIGARALEQQDSLEPTHLRLPPALLGRGHQRHGLGQGCQPGLGLPRLARRLRQQGEIIGAVHLPTFTVDCSQPLVDVGHTSDRVTLHSQRPPPQDASKLDAAPKAVRDPEGHQRLGVRLRGHRIPAILGEAGGKGSRIPQTEGMPSLLGLRQCFLAPLLGLVRIAQFPEGLRE
jgi:hypothetical protein